MCNLQECSIFTQMEKYKNKEWLYNEYITKSRTANEIAKEVNRDPKTVWSWLKINDIPTRPRGGASSSGSFKKGTNLWKGKKHTESTKEKIRQARFRDGGVPYLNKNGVHWLQYMNRENHPLWKGGISGERQAAYSSKEWVNAVKQVWKRDNAICQNCGKHHNTQKNRGNFHIHHIVSFENKQLRMTASNLVLLCRDCHIWVHSKKNVNKKFIKS